MNALRRTSALLEVLGVILVGPLVTTLIIRFLHLQVTNPLTTVRVDITGHELITATRQMFVLLALQYAGYFAVIIPINIWHRRRGPAAYGLTKAERSWRELFLAGVATFAIASLFASPASGLLLADAVYHLGLGETVPWRQALFSTSWCRSEFWLFMTVSSFGFVPVVEELFYRGYCQRRLAEDWGDGAAIAGTTLLLVFSHSQYLVLNAYNIATITKVLPISIGAGVVFAWTRSLIPAVIVHAIINIPMTPLYGMIVLAAVIVGGLLALRRGVAILNGVFSGASVKWCIVLGILGIGCAIAVPRIAHLVVVAMAVIIVAVMLEAVERRSARPSGAEDSNQLSRRTPHVKQ